MDVYKNKGKKIDDEIIGISYNEFLENIDYFKFSTLKLTAAQSMSICAFQSGKVWANEVFKDKKEFIYTPSRLIIPETFVDATKTAVETDFKNFMIKNEVKIKEAFGVLATLNLLMEEMKGKYGKDPMKEVDHDILINTPEFRKFLRLESFYNILTEFTLNILFEFHMQIFKKIKKHQFL